MATKKLVPLIAEVNPLAQDVKATRWMLTAATMRYELYTYLRNLTNEAGEPGDVGVRLAQEIARYTIQRVVQREGFTKEEADHINGQLDQINKLRLQAYPFLHS